ncbi:unnamed protein product [Closterium sp. NIES-65]|nr:unnamed protein product [Closterium sp. NIES-65]
MHRRVLVSGLPRVLPPSPPLPAPPCHPCVEGRQRAAPHSSSFPPTTTPLQTLHTDMWGPAHVSGQDCERYFLLVVGDYSRYTTVFPLRTKGEVPDVLIPWIRAARLLLRERFGTEFVVLHLYSDRGGEFSSDLLQNFCWGEDILQTFTLPASPQQNGVAERRIGLVMEVAHTSMVHAAAPHFLWPFAVRYAAHQLNLWPRVSLPETSPTLWWTGKVGDASVFRVWGSRAFVRDTAADKLSARVVPCVFLGFVPNELGWQFYHPNLRRVFPSQDVTFDEPVCLSLGVRSVGVLSRGVLSLGVPYLGARRRLVSSLPGAAVSVLTPLVPRRYTLVVVSLSPHSSCVSGTLAVRVALLELGALLRDALGLEALELALSLSPHSSCVSGTLAVRVALLELRVLLREALELVLELLGLEVLQDLEVLLSTLRLEALEQEVPVLGALLLESLGLEVPVLGMLLLVVLVLAVLELLEVLALVALELEILELLGVLALVALELEVLELLGVMALVALELEVLELLELQESC